MSTTRTDVGPDVERLEAAMQQRWYALALAEQRGQSAHVLERLFAAYMKALEAYVAAKRRQTAPAKQARVA